MRNKTRGLILSIIIFGAGMWFYNVHLNSVNINNVLSRSQQLTNYTRKSSISISFPQMSNTLKPVLSKIDNSMVQIEEERNQGDFHEKYSFSTQENDFEGERDYEKGVLTLKSPMFQKYIQVTKPSEYGLVFDSQPTDAQILNSLITGLGSITFKTTPTDLNGEKVKEVVINLPDKALKSWFNKTFSAIFDNGELKDFYMEHLLLQNKLLKQDIKESQLVTKRDVDLRKYQDNLNNFLSHVTVKGSQLVFKIDKQNNLRELNVVLHGVYVVNGQNLKFDLYIDSITEDIGTTKIKALNVNKQDSVSYSQMNDSMDYSDITNQDSTKAKDGKSNAVFHEFTSNLKDIGQFKTIIPTTQKNIQQKEKTNGKN